MYLGHFSLREAPFAITPDTEFFYPHEGVQASLNMLLVALRSGEGFVKVVGELGCGKTVLCRQLLKLLQSECVTAYIPNPDMGPDDLLMALVQELGMVVSRPLSRHKILGALHACLLGHAAQGRSVVLCIDEAQAIPLRTVESIRLLSNLETEKRKLLQIVLLGQPELEQKLALPEIRQLLQRITFSEYLGPMHASRVPVYLQHRLQVAALNAHTDTEVFVPQAAEALALWSGGVPRLLNIMAHKCLMLAYGEGVYRVSARHVLLAAQDTPGVRRSPPQASPWWQRWRAHWALRSKSV
ncbi:ExeA family protein [Rhodoferax aquaticus]|uniref:AAA family ATPase n=1 Tax=Rhodoferax aquaticus TaxID=2527691 RepID=A0A515EUU4_9BURK|nr:AAA family ATPase [Rhodoferax aquaticus]QDL56455.1 AAA family ATPase [Rhodoferax aquaticus]